MRKGIDIKRIRHGLFNNFAVPIDSFGKFDDELGYYLYKTFMFMGQKYVEQMYKENILEADVLSLPLENIHEEFKTIYDKISKTGPPDNDEELKMKVNENVWLLSCNARFYEQEDFEVKYQDVHCDNSTTGVMKWFSKEKKMKLLGAETINFTLFYIVCLDPDEDCGTRIHKGHGTMNINRFEAGTSLPSENITGEYFTLPQEMLVGYNSTVQPHCGPELGKFKSRRLFLSFDLRDDRNKSLNSGSENERYAYMLGIKYPEYDTFNFSDNQDYDVLKEKTKKTKHQNV
tara:strand:- start:3791 stop:4654 length:864 start_codon:yes stop_codon:yes gene_type:complete